MEVSKKKPYIRPAWYVFAGFTILILLGALLLSAPVSNKTGSWLNFTDALVTSASAVCVNGLLTLPANITFTGFGQAVILLLIQIGGLGFMTFATLILIIVGKRITLKDRLALSEIMDSSELKGIVKMVYRIVIMTFIIELAGALMLLPFFTVKNGAIGVWQAVFTSVSAFCNCGIDVFGTSLTAFNKNVPVLLIVCLLSVCGGLGFTVIMDLIKNKFRYRRLSLHTKLCVIVSGVLILFGFVVFMAAEYNNSATYKSMSGGYTALNCFFQSVMARSAGFSTVEQAGLTPISKTVTIFLMLIGGCPGGTAAGIKTTTFAVLLLMMYTGIKNKSEIVVAKRTVEARTCHKAVALTVLSVFFSLAAAVILLALEGSQDSSNVFFEAFAAINGAGLTTGVTALAGTASRLLLVPFMFIGRLGPITVSLMFLTKEYDNGIKYPTESLMVG